MKNKFINKDFKEFINVKIIIVTIITAIIMFSIFVSTLANKQYALEAGDVSLYQIVAPKDIINEHATNASRYSAIQNADIAYNTDHVSERNYIKDIDILFTKAEELIASAKTQEERETELGNSTSFKISSEVLKLILSLSNTDVVAVKNIIKSQLQEIYSTTIKDYQVEFINPSTQSDSTEKYKKVISNDVDDAKNAYTESITANSSLSDIERKVAIEIGVQSITANNIFDETRSNANVEKAYTSILPVVIKKGQSIVRDGDQLTIEQIEILKSLGMIKEDGINYIIMFKYVSFVAIIIIYFIILLLYISMNQRAYLKRPRVYAFICAVLVLNSLLIRIGIEFDSLLIPFCLSPFIFAYFLKRKEGLYISLLSLLLFAPIVNYNSLVLILLLISALISYISIMSEKKRNELIFISIWVAFINAIVIAAYELIVNDIVYNTLNEILIASAGLVISAIIAIGVLPLIETSLNLVSSIKLMELTNLNQPLLRKLLLEANGTYHHSMMVANISETAAEEIGADSLLVRVGSIYHDIGKMSNPYFFKENQVNEDENPHDKISSKASAYIIISHVEDGVKLAKQYNLPEEIIDFILEHHGLSLVKYFFVIEKNNSEGKIINEAEYRYKGRLPRSKESGIVSLADSVEAAVRSIPDPTIQKISEMVDLIVKARIDEGQLDDCSLSLKEINIVKKSFVNSLKGIYHKRISYPKEKIEIEKKVIDEENKEKDIKQDKEENNIEKNNKIS